MQNDVKIRELWSLRINPSDLYNIERPLSDNPVGGGGHTYIQVPKRQVEHLLEFLRDKIPPKGACIELVVGDSRSPDKAPEQVQFWAKSAGRMRIAQQNRHRHSRLSAWTREKGFPILCSSQTTLDANALLECLGGLHIYIARSDDGSVWAGFTVGKPSDDESKLPFANILWGKDSPGGYWIYTEKNA